METLHSNLGNSSSYSFPASSYGAPTRSKSESPRPMKRKQITTAVSTPVTDTENFVLKTIPRRLFEILRPHLRRVYVNKEQFLFQQDDELELAPQPSLASDISWL